MFRLLDLPPELWIRICRFAVVEGTIRIVKVDLRGSLARHVAQPALALTCKLLREETLKLFYAENEFRIIDRGATIGSGMKCWYCAICTTWWPMIKNLTLDSNRPDILRHLREPFRIEFDGQAPEYGKKKILKITSLALRD